MAEGFIVRVTHAGTSENPILLSDVESDSRFDSYRGPGPVYVPVDGFVDLIYSSTVAISFEEGAIRKFMDGGYVTTEFISGDAIWDPTTETQDYYLDGASGDDSNDGLSSDNPVKTWSRVLEIMPNYIYNQVVTVHLVGDYDTAANGAIDLSSLSCLGKGYIAIEGELYQTATGTLTDADPDSDGWAIEDGAAAFTADDEGRVIRFTSGADSGSTYQIGEVLSGTKVRLSAPNMYSTPAYSTDDYEVLGYSYQVTGSGGYDAAIRNREPGWIDDAKSGSLRLLIQNLEVSGGIYYVHGRIDLDNVLVHENGVDYMTALTVMGGKYWLNCMAIPSASAPTNSRGIQVLLGAEGQFYSLSGSTNWSPATGSKGWKWDGLQGYRAAYCLFQRAGVFNTPFSAVDSEHAEMNVLGVVGSKDAYARRTIMYLGRSVFHGATFKVMPGTSVVFTSSSSRVCPLDGGGTAAEAIEVRAGGILNFRTYDASSMVIQNYTGSALRAHPGSTITHHGSPEISSCNIGLEATGAQVGTQGTDPLKIDSCTSDGAKFTGCTGAVDLDSDNNGGWGAQFLKATQMHDLGSTFAGNVSGGANTDASSNFVA